MEDVFVVGVSVARQVVDSEILQCRGSFQDAFFNIQSTEGLGSSNNLFLFKFSSHCNVQRVLAGCP
ncbi:hypothetical protein Ancab_016411 [Ancistrocladus abbreviatus]